MGCSNSAQVLVMSLSLGVLLGVCGELGYIMQESSWDQLYAKQVSSYFFCLQLDMFLNILVHFLTDNTE